MSFVDAVGLGIAMGVAVAIVVWCLTVWDPAVHDDP